MGLTSNKIFPMANEMSTPSPMLVAGVKGVIIIPAGAQTRRTKIVESKNSLNKNYENERFATCLAASAR